MCRSYNSFKSSQSCDATTSCQLPISLPPTISTLSSMPCPYHLSPTDSPEESVCCAALQTTITGISDSGADISIASYATINNLDIPIVQLDSPIQLTFANGTTSTTQHVANLGPLGSIHLVNDADSTLISINEIVKQGYNVLYTNEAIHILDVFGSTLFCQQRKPHQSRWPIDIHKAIQQIRHRDPQLNSTTTTTTVQSVRQHLLFTKLFGVYQP